jgi:hypothetical protein
MRSAASAHSAEFSGFPISGPSPHCHVSLEPGLLSSTGITRRRRSYKPLRHPAAPDSAARAAPVSHAPGHITGLPVLRLFFSFVHAVVNTPAESMGAVFRSLPHRWQPSLQFRRFGFHDTHSKHAQRSPALRLARSPSPLKDPLHRRLQLLRYLHRCSDCFRLERVGGIRPAGKSAPFHGARNIRASTTAAIYPTVSRQLQRLLPHVAPVEATNGRPALNRFPSEPMIIETTRRLHRL